MHDKEIPQFESTLPEHLLANEDDARKYMMRTINVMQQSLDWLSKETRKQSATLDRCEALGKSTNGRVTKLEEKNIHIEVSLKDIGKDNEDVVKPIKKAFSLLSHPWIVRIGGIVILLSFFGGVYLYNSYYPEIMGILRKWLAS